MKTPDTIDECIFVSLQIFLSFAISGSAHMITFGREAHWSVDRDIAKHKLGLQLKHSNVVLIPG